MLTFEQMKYFIVLSKTLSFTKTAEQTYTTQPTVSRQIKLLEQEIGCDLLFRSPTGISLTPAGALLAENLSTASQLISDSIRIAKSSSDSQEGSLSVGCTVSLELDRFLVDCYHKFSKQNATVRFSYEKCDHRSLHEKLKNDELDIIVTLDSRTQFLPDIETRYLFEYSGICLFSRFLPVAQKKDLTLSDFSGMSIVCLDENTSPRGLAGIKKIADSSHLKYKSIIRVPNLETVFFYVDAGLAIAFLDTGVEKIKNADFCYIPVPNESATISVAMFYKKNNPNPAISKFVDIATSLSEFRDPTGFRA